MDIEKAKKLLNGIDIKFFLNGTIEQSNYIVDKADEVDKAIETVLNELEKKDNKIKELEGRCRNLDKEAQSYLEELMGNSTLKNRTIKQLNLELEKKEAIINEMAEYMEQEMYEYQLDDIYSELHNCNGMERNWTRCKEAEIKDIKEYFTKKAEEK